jgi:glycosyltransferase involved in cell wall biosynthesis
MQRERVVCFVNHTAEMGGAECALARLIAAMNQERWHPVVVFGEEGPAVDLLRARSVEVYVRQMGEGLAQVRKEELHMNFCLRRKQTVAAARYILTLRQFFKERGVDVVHTNSMKAHVLGGMAALVARIPLVWRLRDSLHPACLPNAALQLMRFLARHLPQRVMSASQSVARDSFGTMAAEKREIVYDGVEEAGFENPAPLPRLKHDGPWRIGIAGRICPWKGQHVFMEAAAKLLERGWDIQFEILGGPLFSQEAYQELLQRFATACTLRQNVLHAGQVDDVPTRIRQWDILVHASTLPDPCPSVILEAMAGGVPVVGADAGGVPELLDYGRCGALFEADNPDALCSVIEDLLNSPQQRRAYVQAARAKALKDYQSERAAREVEQVWEQVFNPHVHQRRQWAWLEGGLGGKPHSPSAHGPATDSLSHAKTRGWALTNLIK